MADITTGITPQTTGTPQSNFKPTFWSAGMLHNYYEVSALGAITCKSPVIHGTTMVYNMASPVQVNLTTTSDPRNGDINYQILTPTPFSIEMNNIATWALQFDDITLFQTNLDLLNGEMQEAGMEMDSQISKSVYADMYNQAALTLGSIEVTPMNAYDYIVDLGTQLNLQNVPKAGRYVMIDYVYLGMLSKDPRFTFQPHILANGMIEGERINGLDIFVSNELPDIKNVGSGGEHGIWAGQKDAYAFGIQFDKVQYFDKLQNSWAEAVRGRALYGHGPLRPNGLVNAQVTYNTSVQPNIVD